jgi:hypothetical protein
MVAQQQYDYDINNKRKLITGNKKDQPIYLLIEGSFEEMGRLGYLKGEALKDYKYSLQSKA